MVSLLHPSSFSLLPGQSACAASNPPPPSGPLPRSTQFSSPSLQPFPPLAVCIVQQPTQHPPSQLRLDTAAVVPSAGLQCVHYHVEDLSHYRQCPQCFPHLPICALSPRIPSTADSSPPRFLFEIGRPPSLVLRRRLWELACSRPLHAASSILRGQSGRRALPRHRALKCHHFLPYQPFQHDTQRTCPVSETGDGFHLCACTHRSAVSRFCRRSQALPGGARCRSLPEQTSRITLNSPNIGNTSFAT